MSIVVILNNGREIHCAMIEFDYEMNTATYSKLGKQIRLGLFEMVESGKIGIDRITGIY